LLLPGRHHGSPHSPPKKDLPVPDEVAAYKVRGDRFYPRRISSNCQDSKKIIKFS
jgi:hypothetical protein